jgi:type IV secretory pathway VirB10-like protein
MQTISNRFKARLKMGTYPYAYYPFKWRGEEAKPYSGLAETKSADTAPDNKEKTMDDTNASTGNPLPGKRVRKPLTPEQRAAKNEKDRLRRAAKKAEAAPAVF